MRNGHFYLIPVLQACDAITTFIGVRMGAAEYNVLMRDVAGTIGGMVLYFAFAVVMARMISLDIRLGNAEKGVVRVCYSVLLVVLAFVVVSNMEWIVMHV